MYNNILNCKYIFTTTQASDKEIKDTKKRGRPSKGTSAKPYEKKIESENGEPVAKRGRGRPKKSGGTKSKPKVKKI